MWLTASKCRSLILCNNLSFIAISLVNPFTLNENDYIQFKKKNYTQDRFY